jgi:DNA segregation ATPase FtsK/SpoIIIE, S-DNA-T family
MERRPRRRQDEEPAQFETPWGTVAAIALLALGMAGYLALVSYDPRDIHNNWTLCKSLAVTSRPNDPVNNIIGPVGAYLGGCVYLLFGAAAYLLPTSMVWFGVSMLVSRSRLTGRTLAGLGLLMLSAPALLSVQDIFLRDWALENSLLQGEPGGGLGWILGDKMLAATIGKVGALLVLTAAYTAGLIMITGLDPLQFFGMCRSGIGEVAARWRESHLPRLAEASGPAFGEESGSDPAAADNPMGRRGRKLRSTNELAAPSSSAAPLDIDDELIIPGHEVAKKLGLAMPVPAAPPPAPEALPLQLDLGLPTKPEPKIIDSSERKSPGADRPSLAEIRRKARELKKPDPAAACLGSSALRGDFSNYELPDLDLLAVDDAARQKPADKGALLSTQQMIIRTLATFGITVLPGDITRGPTITRYEIYPEEGLRVSRITALEDDLARTTKAERINILAPIPGKDTVGIEIANHDKVPVPLRELIEDPAFTSGKAKLPLALGKDVYGNVIVGDLASMPHLLVAGATGSGKSVCINSIIGSLLFQFTPDQLRFIMVDPKVVEMQQYNDLPHLVIPVVTDPKKTLAALNWVVNEMETRYHVFADVGVRNFDSFNKRPLPEKTEPEPRAADAAATTPVSAACAPARQKPPARTVLGDQLAPGTSPVTSGEIVRYQSTPTVGELTQSAFHAHEVRAVPEADEGDLNLSIEAGDTVWRKEDDFHAVADAEPKVPERYPYIVVIIDELADLMQTAPAEIEIAICRIAQKARAAGIHLILATQTPRADVITGVIKANIPCKIAFQVSNALDSRVILDAKGAEKLVGKGDMLYLPPGSAKLLRAQGAFVTDDDVHRLVNFCKSQARPSYVTDIKAQLEGAGAEAAAGDEITEEDEDCYEKCLEVITQEKRASTSLLQRRLRLGYTRAARMMDIMEQRGIIGPGEGAKPREILVDLSESEDT